MTNLWVSDEGVAQGEAQWCRLEWDAPLEISRVQIAWGLDFSRPYVHTPALFQAPECARDYQIEAEYEDGSRALWCEVRGNYQRLRVHPKPPQISGLVRAIVISVTATNGDPHVQICEVRAYDAE